MVSVGDLLAVRIVGSQAGQPIMNTFGFSVITPSLDWNAQALQAVTELDTALGLLTGTGVWHAARSTLYRVEEVQVIDVSPGVAPLSSFASGTPGLADASPMAPNDALAITWRSASKGVSGRGRSYLGGYPEAEHENGFWTSVPQDAASAIGAAMIDSFGEAAGGASIRFCVINHVALGVRLTTPTVKPVMAFTIHNEVRSIGRRAVGRRIHRRRTP